jgi:hypothetical protein
MDAVYRQLLEIEEALGTGAGDVYRRYLAQDAIVVVPGAVLDREQCAEAMDASPGWDEHEITDVRTARPAPDAAILSYRWRSRRGEVAYEALMSSAYARRDGEWQLVLHQQTPQPGDAS